MSVVARGKAMASLLHKGYGVRGSPTISAFSGWNLPNVQRDEQQQQASAMAINGNMGSVHFGRRFLHVRRAPRRGPIGGRQSRYLRATKPSMEIAAAMPLTVQQMANSELITLGALGNSDAVKEILKRHIMDVDKVSYETANEKFEEIALTNRKGMWMLSLPYKIGITLALGGAIISVPMVFDLTTVTWFNEHYVTADVPEPQDLETPLEVGSWAWNWMEPVLGHISFVLLCLQYSRAQIANMGIHPYTDMVFHRRARALADAYPQYDAKVVMDFAKVVKLYGDKHSMA